MPDSLTIHLFSAAIPLNLGQNFFNLGLDNYQYYYLFTPSRQILKKRKGNDGEDEAKEILALGNDLTEQAYTCGRFFDERGELAWISEDCTIYCALCGEKVPDALESLAAWENSDFTLTKSKDHRLLLWDPKRKAQQWEDSHIPRIPAYGIEGDGLPTLIVREWSCEDKPEEKYIQYVSLLKYKKE